MQTAHGDGKQRVDVLLAGCGDAENLRIDGLFPRQLDLSQQPPDGGVKPEHGADDLFDHRGGPIAAADVCQLVTDDGLLRAARERQKLRWKQDRGLEDSECDGAGDVGRKADRWPCTDALLEGVECRERGYRFRAAAVAAEAQ